MNIGFIGAGNMAQAIIGGILENGVFAPDQVRASNPGEAKRLSAAKKFGIQTTADNKDVAAWADVVVLAVKPQVLAGVIDEIRAVLAPTTLVISIAAGKSLDWLGSAFGTIDAQGAYRSIVRVMPNTPALVGQGVSGMCANASVSQDQRATAESIFNAVGASYWMSESMVDVIGVVAGCTPAFVAMFIEALSDAAVAHGMPRAQALAVAARAVAGSAQLAVETGTHPALLKDMVTSPGGTTIQGVRVLEERGLRSSVMGAVDAAMEKTKAL